MTVMSLAPVALVVQEAYELKSSIPVNLCAMSFSCCSVPMTFVAIWAYGKYSTNFVLRVVVTMQYIGALFRLVTVLNGFFWPILCGTIIEACAAPFILNCQIIICNKWFSDKERALGTALLTVSMPVGTALAFALTGYYFQDVSGDNKENVNSLLKC